MNDGQAGRPPCEQWWVINGQCFLEALKRVQTGEDLGLIYLEYWANSDVGNG